MPSSNIDSNTCQRKTKDIEACADSDHIYDTIGDHTYSTITPRKPTSDDLPSYVTINNTICDDAVELRMNVAYGMCNIAQVTDNNDDIA